MGVSNLIHRLLINHCFDVLHGRGVYKPTGELARTMEKGFEDMNAKVAVMRAELESEIMGVKSRIKFHKVASSVVTTTISMMPSSTAWGIPNVNENRRRF